MAEIFNDFLVNIVLNVLSVNSTKWSNTLKQIVISEQIDIPTKILTQNSEFFADYFRRNINY